MHKEYDLPLDQINSIALEVSQKLKKGSVLFLQGEIGAGKTTFVRELLQVLQFEVDEGSSPTFPIMNVYSCSRSNFDQCIHIDLYRIKSADEILMLGLDTMDLQNSLILVEWPEIISENEWKELFLQLGISQKPLNLSISYNPTLNQRKYNFTF